jgi:hypothetical protein
MVASPASGDGSSKKRSLKALRKGFSERLGYAQTI